MSIDIQKPLSRDEFRTQVFLRDKNCCVICKKPAQDAHHILERKLWKDGSLGYFKNNGASLCKDCHLKAEMTVISVEEIRKAAGISESEKLVPEHLYPDQVMDKWANPILPSGLRMRGELFDDPNVQKILEAGNVLNCFTKYVKYPRTYHLPFSPGITKDDRVLKSTEHFKDKEVVVTLKLDGECTTGYSDYIHARSTSDKKHWSKDWIKNFHSKIAHEIPEGWRIVLENVYAEHSIFYQNLKSYCYGISVWNDKNICLSWNDTLVFFEMLNIVPVPVIYQGVWDEPLIRDLHKPYRDGDECEGFVVRLIGSFHYGEFSQSVAKWVRASHVKENDHWFYGKASRKNKLALENKE